MEIRKPLLELVSYTVNLWIGKENYTHIHAYVQIDKQWQIRNNIRHDHEDNRPKRSNLIVHMPHMWLSLLEIFIFL